MNGITCTHSNVTLKVLFEISIMYTLALFCYLVIAKFYHRMPNVHRAQNA